MQSQQSNYEPLDYAAEAALAKNIAEPSPEIEQTPPNRADPMSLSQPSYLKNQSIGFQVRTHPR